MPFFTLEILNKYLVEEEAKPVEKEVEKSENDVGGGFEFLPAADEIGEEIKKGDKDVCHVEFIENATEEAKEMIDAQEKPEEFTVVISNVKDRILCNEFKKKMEEIGFPSINDEDADKDIPKEVEEEGAAY